MSDFVWISTAPGHASNMRPLRNDISETDPARFDVARAKIKAGVSITVEDCPKMIFGAPHAKEKDYNLPDLFTGYGYWVVSKAAADVLRQFDMGGGGLYPVRILKNDRTTLVPGEYFCLNFGNVKDTFLPDQSEKILPFVRDIWSVMAGAKDWDLCFGIQSINGPDIWLDPKVDDAFLLSAALGLALKKAKADKGFFLKKCRVVQSVIS